ncbi:MAG: phosphoenolpyruvate-protein phosphotransferase [Acidobacteria bacterium]|nr:phosphoenolpyruvate-protein phosphotransferase [Acidobacteriota bacterium]
MARVLDFAFPLPNGLHARPAAVICAAAARFRSAITFVNTRSDRSADARSALALVATLTRHGDPCALRVEGDDEATAAATLQRLLDVELSAADEPTLAPAARAGDRPLPRALTADGTTIYRGVPASGGIVRSRAVVLGAPVVALDVGAGPAASVAEETARLDGALAEVGAELRERVRRAASPTERAIFTAHLSLLEDVELRRRMLAELAAGAVPASRAVLAAADYFAAILEASDSAYLRERSLDVRDLAAQLVRALAGGGATGEPAPLDRPAACFAATLTPAGLLALGTGRIDALVLAEGGVTSHIAILARALGIPCVTGVAGVQRLVVAGQDVVVDGERGLVVPDPSPGVVRFYEREAAKLDTLRRRAEALAAGPGHTADGVRLEVAANVGSADEARLAFARGAEGIGLLRTELLFLDCDRAPDEDEQAARLVEIVRAAAGRPVIVRTFDVGADKPLPWLDLSAEANPFLGVRAVRLYPGHAELTAAQVRAILRASALGPVRIMVPMVTRLEEIRDFRALVEREQQALAARGVPFDAGIEIGIMVETPAAALTIGDLAAVADFFSIGSNDLAQYVFAADRGNRQVADLANPLHPAFLRLLRTIVEDVHARGRRVGLCGEFGGAVGAAPLLVGLGLDEVSVAAFAVPAIKAAIAGCNAAACRKLLAAALERRTVGEVEALLRVYAATGAAVPLVSRDTVRLHSGARSRDEAIRELVDLLHLDGRVDDPDGVEAAVWAREAQVSTGVGFGVAIPHCSSPGVRANSIAAVRLSEPVDWHSGDDRPVDLAILIAIRADALGEEHLRAIAGLSRRLMDEEFRGDLAAAIDGAEVAALLDGAAAATQGGGS